MQFARLLAEFGYEFHAPTAKQHFPSVLFGKVHNLLNPVVVGGKGGNDYPSGAVRHKHLFQTLPHPAFGFAVPLTFDVGAFAKHKQNAFFAYFLDPCDVGKLAVDRGIVHFVVAGKKHYAGRRRDAKGRRARYAVANFDKFNGKRAYFDGSVFGNDRKDVGGHPLIFQFVRRDAKRKTSPVNGHLRQVLQNVRQRADVILVAVRQNYADHLFAVGFKIFYIGNNDVHPGSRFVREPHARVDNQNIVAVFQGGHIFADFADAAEKHNFQKFI